MPVIRVDDEVWKELQKRAEPLVDTPNTVLRRLLGLDVVKPDDERVIENELGPLHSQRKWALIRVPKQKRHFFPGYKVYFNLETDVGTIRTRMTSAAMGTPVGDPNGGAYIQGGLRPWYDNHPELQPSDKLRFEALKPGEAYKLSVIHG